jgi:hypothetical protein
VTHVNGGLPIPSAGGVSRDSRGWSPCGCSRLAWAACLVLASVGLANGRDAAGPGPATTPVDYGKLADLTVRRAWKLEPGERVVFFWDPAYDRGMAEALRAAVAKAGATVEVIAAPTAASVTTMTAAERRKRDEGWKSIFARSQAAIWLPSDLTAVDDHPFERLVEGSSVRSVHFHWFLPPDRNEIATVEAMYEAAILVPPEVLERRIATVEHAVRGAIVRITATNGTDLSFSVPGTAWVHRNTGVASRQKVAEARSVRDREEELPAGVFRTTGLVNASGTFVGYTSFNPGSPIVRAVFSGGKVVRLVSVRGAERQVTEWAAASGAKDLPGEFVVGTNPALTPVMPSGFMPYYGYGSGVVRIAIGDNWESGGPNRSSNGELLMFLPGATVTASGHTVVRDGVLEATD